MNIKKLQSRIKFADDIALNSKDQSTKVGAVFYDEHESYPLTFGYNGMPRGLNDNHPERNERPEKYLWYEHAERNAIYNLAFNSLKDCVTVLTHFPTMEDARAIVSVGIKKVIFNKDNIHLDKDMIKRVVTLFKETNVTLEGISYKEKNETNGKKLQFLNIVESFTKSESLDFDLSQNEMRGAMIFKDDKSFRPISAGVFGLPSNLKVTDELLKDKNTWFQEEFKNAVFNISRKELQNSVGAVTWCPCAKCSLGIISSGSKKIITRKPNFNNEADLRWKETFEISQNMLNKTNLELEFIEELNLENIKKPKGGFKN